MAAIYRAKVTELARALQEPESRSEATEALRGLVDAIVLTPDQGGETLQIELRGNLAAMLGATDKRRGRQNLTTSPCKYRWLRGHATSGTCSCGAARRDSRESKNAVDVTLVGDAPGLIGLQTTILRQPSVPGRWADAGAVARHRFSSQRLLHEGH